MTHAVSKGLGQDQIAIHWLPGKIDVEGNELGDREAELTAKGRDLSSPVLTCLHSCNLSVFQHWSKTNRRFKKETS